MLLKESHLCQRLQKDMLLKMIQDEPGNFPNLISWSLQDEQPLGWRATWLLKQIIRKNDERLVPHIDQAISHYPNFDESQKREWLKIFLFQALSEEQEGRLLDFCLNDWQRITHHPALRASAMSLTIQILKKYPELTQEVQHLMQEEYLSALSPGIRRSLEKQWTALLNSCKC